MIEKKRSFDRLNVLQHSTGDIYCTLDGDDYFCDTEFIKEASLFICISTNGARKC